VAYEGTEVAVHKSQEQIRKLIMAHRGSSFMALSERDNGITSRLNQEGFQAQVIIDGKVYAVRVMAQLKDPKMKFTPVRTADFHEKEARRIWRVLYHHMKSVFEAADSGVMEFRELMLPYVVTGNGRTVAECIIPRLDAVVSNGRLLSE
jgi:hypothetical protein